MNINNKFCIFINDESWLSLLISKLKNSPFNLIGNLFLSPSIKGVIGSIKSNSPKSQDEKLSVNTSVTVNSKSLTLFANPLSVTKPTGLITSPFLNPNPDLVILNEFTWCKVDPIPVVGAAATSTVNLRPNPVSVVAPIPNLDTPTTSKSSYVGGSTSICGLTYPVPPFTTVKANVPPAPTVAVIFAPVPPPPPGWTSIVIVLVVTAVIAVWTPAIGSGKPVVLETARGYGWSVAKWSLEQLKTIPPVSIPTVSLVDKPWFGMVRTKIPVWDVYSAFVAVNAWLPAPENAAFFIEPIPELTNLCS